MKKSLRISSEFAEWCTTSGCTTVWRCSWTCWPVWLVLLYSLRVEWTLDCQSSGLFCSLQVLSPVGTDPFTRPSDPTAPSISSFSSSFSHSKSSCTSFRALGSPTGETVVGSQLSLWSGLASLLECSWWWWLFSSRLMLRCQSSYWNWFTRSTGEQVPASRRLRRSFLTGWLPTEPSRAPQPRLLLLLYREDFVNLHRQDSHYLRMHKYYRTNPYNGTICIFMQKDSLVQYLHLITENMWW